MRWYLRQVILAAVQTVRMNGVTQRSEHVPGNQQNDPGGAQSLARAGEEGANGSFHRQESRACGGSLVHLGRGKGARGPPGKVPTVL